MLDLIVGAVLAGIALQENKNNKAEQAMASRNAEVEARRIEAKLKAQQQKKEKEALIRQNTLNEMYAKLAICFYIAWADNHVTPMEKYNLDTVYWEVYKHFPNDPEVRNELQQIYATTNFSFINLEKYLRNTTPEAIASFLQVADEIAASDGYSSEEEKKCIFKIRKYLTDRTGKNYTGIINNPENKIDLTCPGCYATMDIQPHNGIAVCPYCGNTKYLYTDSKSPEKKKTSKQATQKEQPEQKNTFRCPVCMTLLSAKAGTKTCICAKCKTKLKVNNGQAAIC